MSVKQTEIKVVLPSQIKELLKIKAQTHGLTQAAYVRHLIFQNVSDVKLKEIKRSGPGENITHDEIQELLNSTG